MNDLTQQYDGKTFSGSQVRSAAVQLVNRDESGITVQILNSENDQVVSNGVGQNSFKSGSASTSEINKALSGKDSIKYSGSVSTTNGTVTVKFIKKS